MSKALVSAVFFGRAHFLSRNPDEWVPDAKEATQFDPYIARKIADSLGGTVVLLDQKRTVEGTIGGADRGPRQ